MKGIKSLSLTESRGIYRTTPSGGSSSCSDQGSWQWGAACRAAPDPDAFIFKSRRSQDVLDLERMIKDYCEGCPVRAACDDASTVSDRQYSIRGGSLPRAVDSPSPDPGVEDSYLMKRGECMGRTERHLIKGWKDVVIRDGTPRCRQCLILKDAKGLAARKARLKGEPAIMDT